MTLRMEGRLPRGTPWGSRAPRIQPGDAWIGP